MIRLVIEGIDADVLQTESIIGEYVIAPIGDISKRLGAKTIQFKLPKTATNRQIFESCEVITSTSKIPYRKLTARIYVDGIDMRMLFCTLESVDTNYNIRLYGSNVDFYTNLKDKMLSDLSLNEYNHHWEISSLPAMTDPDYPMKYCVIDYNSDSPNDAINTSDSEIFLGTLMPSMYEHFLIEKICAENGYTVNNKTRFSPIFKDNIPVIPLGTAQYERDNDFSRYLARFTMEQPYTGLSLFGTWLNVDTIISQSQTYWIDGGKENLPKGTNTDSSYFKIPDQAKIRVRLQFEYRVGTGSTNNPFNAVISFVPTSTQIISGGSFGTQFTIVPDNTWQIFDQEVWLDCFNPINPGLGQFHTPGFTIWIEKSDEFGVINIIETRYSELEINHAERLTDATLDITYHPIIDREYTYCFGYVTVANNLPIISQADFVKNYLLKTNSILEVNEGRKEVIITPFKTTVNNIGSATDWSGKLDYTNVPKVTFDLKNYGQVNTLEYADTDGVVKPTGTDKQFLIDDKNLPDEKKIATLIYSATGSTYRLGYGEIPKIDIFAGYERAGSTKPRCLFMHFGSGSFEYRGNLLDNANSLIITSNIPYCHFIDANQEYSYGFGESLFDNFFSFIVGIINSTKIVELPIRLTTTDISTFDFLKPIYINELDAHFYVNKIKFDYTKNVSSICELIKLL